MMCNSASSQETLSYSIVVPVYNGALTIVRCLDALAAQTVAPECYEIIVVDDGSTDGTAELIGDWRVAHPHIKLRLLRQANGGPAAARNHGAETARAPLLLFTDADCAPVRAWIAVISAPFQDPEVIGVKGAYLTAQSSLVSRFVQAEYEDRYDRMCDQPQIDFIDTYSAAYRRSVFVENRGFDPALRICEDQEFSFRLAQKGYRLVFAPAARVSHLHDGNLGEYFHRKYSIGFWKALMIRWHPERMVQDSHTPQVLKVQIVLLAATFGLIALALLGLAWAPLSWAWAGVGAASLLFLATTLPFTLKLARGSPALGADRAGDAGGTGAGIGRRLPERHHSLAGTLSGAHQPVITGWQRLIKRSMDVLGALAGLVVSIPLVAVAALAIKLDSPGPVFFWQVRVGENGRLFRIIKLRTMVADAEAKLDNLVDLDALTEPAFKLKHDPRVTRVGRLLRRTSLDEAPQFYNVLRGDMSLVGPRPEEMRVVQLYRDDQRRRLAVKPGYDRPDASERARRPGVC
jgi:lipopolysaccharide/colanic/teichoic acid biosynthesis glycosyltransferase/glycosyltransferase involved in cell wall biosynthesis